VLTPLAATFDLADAQRPMLNNLRKNIGDQRWVLPGYSGHVAPDPFALNGLGHPPPQKWMHTHRQMRCLVAPVIEDVLCFGEVVDEISTMRPKTSKQWQFL